MNISMFALSLTFKKGVQSWNIHHFSYIHLNLLCIENAMRVDDNVDLCFYSETVRKFRKTVLKFSVLALKSGYRSQTVKIPSGGHPSKHTVKIVPEAGTYPNSL